MPFRLCNETSKPLKQRDIRRNSFQALDLVWSDPGLRPSRRERAILAERLIESLGRLEQAEVERLWIDEAERRLAAHGKGKIASRPADDVFNEAYRRVKLK